MNANTLAFSPSLTPSGKLSRRGFLGVSASVGLVVAFHIPFTGAALAQSAQAPEVNAWVVVKPDDSVVIRIARSEMGQGTLTGLAQRVAEELDCDWAKVSTEYPTPGQSLARGRIWGNFGTGGSRGVRESQDYMRKGGATARMMLVQAAADEWKVPATECSAARRFGLESGVHVVLPSACWIISAATLVSPPLATTLMAARIRL